MNNQSFEWDSRMMLMKVSQPIQQMADSFTQPKNSTVRQRRYYKQQFSKYNGDNICTHTFLQENSLFGNFLTSFKNQDTFQFKIDLLNLNLKFKVKDSM